MRLTVLSFFTPRSWQKIFAGKKFSDCADAFAFKYSEQQRALELATFAIFFRARDLVFLISFVHQVLKMSQHFQGPFELLVLTFCGPSPSFESNWPKGPPYFDP